LWLCSILQSTPPPKGYPVQYEKWNMILLHPRGVQPIRTGRSLFVPSQDLDFHPHMSSSFLCSIIWGTVVRFRDIGWIVYHPCLNVPLIIDTICHAANMIFYPYCVHNSTNIELFQCVYNDYQLCYCSDNISAIALTINWLFTIVSNEI
jgi:hypothetical protein